MHTSANEAIFGSDNVSSPVWRQAIFFTKYCFIINSTTGNNLHWRLNQNSIFTPEKRILKLWSGKCWPFCFELNVLIGLSNESHYVIQLLINHAIRASIADYHQAESVCTIHVDNKYHIKRASTDICTWKCCYIYIYMWINSSHWEPVYYKHK